MAVQTGLVGEAGDGACRVTYTWEDTTDVILTVVVVLTRGTAAVILDQNPNETFVPGIGTTTFDLTPFSVHRAGHQLGFRWGP